MITEPAIDLVDNPPEYLVVDDDDSLASLLAYIPQPVYFLPDEDELLSMIWGDPQ
jgi:hypothetical protein